MKTSFKPWLSLLALATGTTGTAWAAEIKGPNSSQTPYVVGLRPDVSITSILTVGDSVNNKPGTTQPYRMVGIPDGLGAYDNGDGTFTVLMNHELRGKTDPPAGVVRAHGAAGSFVSKWIINKKDLSVVRGEDLIQQVATWNTSTSSYNAPAKGIEIGRLCSADLPPQSALYSNGAGFNGRLFLSGEEVGAEGRLFAHALDGTSYELPRLGKFSWENALANPGTGTKTVVIGTDDSTPGQLYLYVGNKTNSGSPVDRAGLTNGSLFGIKVAGFPQEDNPSDQVLTRTSGIPSGTPFTLHPFGNVENTTGAQLDAASKANGVTDFLRPEDGHWDQNNPNIFYFVTTDRFDTTKNGGTGNRQARSRLWRLRFNDVKNPESGGTIDMLLDGTEPHQMLDNMTATKNGEILLQEDPGNNAYLAKIHLYNMANDSLTPIAQHDPARFISGAPGFITADEESSGIIDVSDILGRGWYIADVQAHKSLGGELVEDGQLFALRIAPPNEAPVAQTDTYQADEDSSLVIPVAGVLSNDTDPDGDALSAEILGQPANGTVQLNANGSFTYTPNSGFVGSDSFTYRAKDVELLSNVATVNITVREVNDAPVVTVPATQSTLEDNALALGTKVSISDDAANNEIDVEVTVSNGVLSLSRTTGLTFGQGDGTDDATMIFSGTLANINEALKDARFTPVPNFNGESTLIISTEDNGFSGGTNSLSDVDSFKITVLPVNDAPVAVADSFSIGEDATLNIVVANGVLRNDSDVDGDALSAEVVTQPSRGTLQMNANGSFVYTPQANFTGTDSFTYRAKDASLSSAVVTVTISVGMQNDAPVARDDAASSNNSAPVEINVLANDSDNDGDRLTVVDVRNGLHGSTQILSDGKIRYTPVADFAGSDEFAYTISDGNGAVSTARVRVSISDTTAPAVSITDPQNGSAVNVWNVLRGTVSNPLNSTVRVSIVRASDKRYWNGGGWVKEAVTLPTSIAGEQWILPSGLMPGGSTQTDDTYIVTAEAIDRAGNKSQTQIRVLLDRKAPELLIITPRDKSNLRTLPNILGRAVDPKGGTGTKKVVLFLRRAADGQYWSGSAWSNTPTALTTELNVTSWIRRNNLPQGENLTNGTYYLLAIAYDGANNRSQAQSTFRIVSANPTR